MIQECFEVQRIAGVGQEEQFSRVSGAEGRWHVLNSSQSNIVLIRRWC